VVAQVDRRAALRVTQLAHRAVVRDVQVQEMLRHETLPEKQVEKRLKL
jgi:hypothetical protein